MSVCQCIVAGMPITTLVASAPMIRNPGDSPVTFGVIQVILTGVVVVVLLIFLAAALAVVLQGKKVDAKAHHRTAVQTGSKRRC